jgi:hypothetical protein
MRAKVDYVVVWGAVLSPVEMEDGRWTWGFGGIVDGSTIYTPSGEVIDAISTVASTEDMLTDVEISDETDNLIDTFEEV